MSRKTTAVETAPGTFRQAMSWLHTWAGLVLGWLLYFMCITGSLGYFDEEISRWMQPEIPFADKTLSQSHYLALAEQRLQQVAPDAPHWFINFPAGRHPFLLIEWQPATNLHTGEEGEWREEILNPNTGRPVSARDTGGGQTLYAMHYALHYLPELWAYSITSLAALFMLLALLTGLVIHKKIFKEFFTFRPSNKPRAWLDMHNLISVLPLPFHLMITYSGLVFLMFTTMPGVIAASYGLGEENQTRFFDEIFADPPHQTLVGVAANGLTLHRVLADVEGRWGPHSVAYMGIENRGHGHAQIEVAPAAYQGLAGGEKLSYKAVSGEPQASPITGENSSALKFYELLLALHQGQFAGVVLRWLYFLSGLLSAGMVATGLLLWALKRRQTAEKKGRASLGLRVLEGLNAGAIVGLPIALAAYFWANRLLPVNMAERAEWEVHSLFIALTICLCYPLFRPASRAWFELLWSAALLYSALPLFNALVLDKHLGHALTRGDWVIAGLDMALLACAVLFALAALKLQRLARVRAGAIEPVALVNPERVVV